MLKEHYRMPNSRANGVTNFLPPLPTMLQGGSRIRFFPKKSLVYVYRKQNLIYVIKSLKTAKENR